MIQSRRNLHRITFAILAVVLAVVVIAGLALRTPRIPVSEFAPGIASRAGFAYGRGGSTTKVADGAFEITVEREGGQITRMSLRPTVAILAPDLLVYWLPEATPPASVLPADGAVLVGSLAGTARRRLSVPGGAVSGAGQIVVYSLGRKSVVTGFPLRAATTEQGK